MTTVTPQVSIQDLPPELLGIVQDFLPLYDAVRLGLCSRRLKERTDPHLWKKVLCNIEHEKSGGIRYVGRNSDGERWTFLKGIEPQVPQLELCHYCRIFHPRLLSNQSLWRPLTTDIHQECDCDTKEVQFRRWGIDWGFGFRDVYAIMMRQALSLKHGVALSDLCISTDWTFARAYRNLHNASRSPFKRFVSYTKLDTEAVIRDEHLLVHRIQRLWMPIHLQGTDVLVRYGAGDIAGDFKICAHHGPQSGEMINNFTIPLREGIKYVLAARRMTSSDEDGPLPYIIKRCEDCPTEYAISCHVHDDNSVEVVINVWQNLGTCQSPQTSGWLNCWGMLNVRLCETPDDTSRTAWYHSGVGYVADATLFQTRAGTSAVGHPSSAPVLREWSQIQGQAAASLQAPGRNNYLDVVPQLSTHHFRKIRSSIINARYETGPRRPLHPFRHEFRGNDGQFVPTDRLRYTRSLYWGKNQLNPVIQIDTNANQTDTRTVEAPTN
ncbi:hypothetical protein BKA67DRAFT_537729 [Truncatella angustata]|uniref:F-box domain-containing protein n=1 Tax=Truncatella angustata TaxID=152316 RepID=A0A9P8UGQ7_9PEZI|nr:uncharacterized protein BKA67DRAFT_537729 [Truncatella angustata]KAH6651880.1 hypothetical protein BKA67DRAFT_537729 [Truncatella angustata]KAH8193657.1 hypothetical protein TruAng_012174 [Truncatella angustata]